MVAAHPLPDLWAVTGMPAKPKLADPGALIKAGKLKTAEFRVCMDPDLVEEYERLLLARDAAKEAAQDSLAGGRAVEVEAEIAKVLEQIEEQTITLVIKALPRPKFRAMKDEHPPRKDAEGNLVPDDRRLAVNVDTFFDVLIRAELVSPVLDEDTLTVLLEERLTDGQWDALTTAAWNLNLEKVDVPFSPAVSPSRRNSSRR